MSQRIKASLTVVFAFIAGVAIGITLATVYGYNRDGGPTSIAHETRAVARAPARPAAVADARESNATADVAASWARRSADEAHAAGHGAVAVAPASLVADTASRRRPDPVGDAKASKATKAAPKGGVGEESVFIKEAANDTSYWRPDPVGDAARSKAAKADVASAFLEEYIPSSLLYLYTNAKLQFEISRSMLRRSRPVVGNTERLHAYLRKLRAGRCTTTLVIGGSVSGGHHVRRPGENAYPALLDEWLNARYPCAPLGAAGPARHRHVGTHASSSQSHFSAWGSVERLAGFDLVLVELNVNDHFIENLPHALEDKGEFGDTEEYISAWYFEVMLRRLLKTRKPDPPALVTFNADYLGRIWGGKESPAPNVARQTLFYFNQEPMKNWLSSLYEIPVFSAVQWMLPLAQKQGLQFNKSANPYATSAWHTDLCCHPRAEGHRILALVLAYCLVEEEKVLRSGNETDKLDVERDFTAAEEPFLRNPVYLSPEEDALYVQNNVESANIDFTNPKGKASWENNVTAVEGWTWYADNTERDKYGFSTNASLVPPGGQHIAISLTGGRHGVVEVSYVVSYENFGTALTWFDDFVENKEKQYCENPVDLYQQEHKEGMQRLFAHWEEQASVPKADLLAAKLGESETKVLHICLTPRSEKIAVGPENKFKLLGVRVY